MATRLTDLKVAEVSLVRKPANKRAFLIYKHEEGGNGLMVDINEKVLEALGAELPAGLIDKLEKAKLSKQGQEAIKSVVQLLSAYKKELPEDVLETLADLAQLELPKQEAEEEEEDLRKTEASIAKSLSGYPEPIKKEDGSFDLSQIPEEQRPLIEALWKQSERSERLEKELSEEKERRLLKEFVEKARTYDHLPITAEELGPILKALSERVPDEFAKMEGLFKSVNESLGQSKLFEEMGSGRLGPSGAWNKLEQLATALVQKDAALTKEQAITRILEENPDLYAEYLAERK